MESYNDNLHKKSSSVLYEYAKQMRRNSTKAEEKLWQRLRSRQVTGLKFRRQHPIDKFIVDFYCHEINLAVELDGDIHNESEQRDLDSGRTETLKEFGINVIRFQNEEVLYNIENVISKLTEEILSLRMNDDKKTKK
jgi:very-short-patch-repair endonuclease